MPEPSSGPPSRYDALAHAGDPADESLASVTLDPEEALAPELASGAHHFVESVHNDGFSNRYRVVTRQGSLEVEGIGLLRKRIHEIEVLAVLEEQGVSADKVYLLSTANAARGPLEGAAQLILHPVRSFREVPTGMWSYARRIVELSERKRTFHEDDYPEELIGFSDAKREWAYRLGVDVYSQNEQLQQTLDRYAWLSLGGGLTVRVPLMVVSGPAGYALTVSSTTDQMKRELRDRAPEEVRREVRRRLARMGVAESLCEQFVGHPWYSPSRLLAIAEALATLDGVVGREHLVEVAMQADEPQEAHIFTRLALMLSAYAELEAPLAELLAPNGLLMARTREGDFVVPLYLDWARWTEAMAHFVEAMEQSLPEPLGRRRLLVSGHLSPQTREQLVGRGWRTTEGLEFSWLAAIDAAAWRPGEPDPDRVLPEFGARREGTGR